jgi:hypothetical protein
MRRTQATAAARATQVPVVTFSGFRDHARHDREIAVRTLTLSLLLLASPLLQAAPEKVDEHRWTGVERIVAIGDLHGDYDAYLTVLQAAGIVDAKGQWIAGATHLVQAGDIPDRGPDTRRIIAHLDRLARDAHKRGGRVHALMGNHEAMNVTGDLRYVDPGEYAAFADARSAARRDRYYQAVLDAMKRDDPAAFAALPADHRAAWDNEHPLGWVEHRAAWDPRWNPKGELYQWTLRAPVAVQVNDFVFVHGGLGSAYCGNTLASLSALAHDALRRADPATPGILEDPRGPLWYRGLAGVEPAASREAVDAILAQHDAKHLVVGHTPTGGIVWPRLDARVIQVDTGLSKHYGRHIAWLEVTPQGMFAGYLGAKLPLPATDDARAAYLDAVIALAPGNTALLQRRDALRAGRDAPGIDGEASTPATPPAPAPVTCDTSR